MKNISFAFCFLFIVTQLSFGTTYYAQGNSNPNVLAYWNTFSACGGTSPTDFTTGVGDIFQIQTGHTMTLTGSAWTISGTGLCQIDNGATLICSVSIFTTGLTIANGGILTATSTGALRFPMFSSFTFTKVGPDIRSQTGDFSIKKK